MTEIGARPFIALWTMAIAGFVAGFLAVLIFHQGLWYLLHEVGMIPPERPAWPLDPVPPFGVPSVISKAFWGGLWGAALAPLLGRWRGEAYWAAWILIGAVALTVTALYVVSPLKGEAVRALWPRLYYALLVNGAWGFGTALVLKLFGAARP
jgi:hypothetical protein